MRCPALEWRHQGNNVNAIFQSMCRNAAFLVVAACIQGLPGEGILADGTPGLVGAQPLHYKAVVISPKGYLHSIATGATGREWVGYGLPVGHRHVSHAILVSRSGKVIDLNPAGFLFSVALATDGKLIVGAGGTRSSTGGGALVWQRSGHHVSVLNPRGYFFSQARSACLGQVVGYVQKWIRSPDHAALWRRVSDQFIDLNPPGFASSSATGTDGTHQVGSGKRIGGRSHAIIWSGTARSFRDINPKGWAWSRALGIHGEEVVGRGGKSGQSPVRAILWRGLGARFTDLTPRQDDAAQAFCTNGTLQVGAVAKAVVGGRFDWHAAAWRGTRASATDLQTLLPRRYWSSIAYDVNSHGIIFGFAMGRGRLHIVAVEWIPVLAGGHRHGK